MSAREAEFRFGIRLAFFSCRPWNVLLTPSPVSVLDRVAAGDASAMEECVARYGGLVWSLARRFLPSQTDAEDAVQDIFVDLWRSAGRFDDSLASEPTFIATIARRRLIDRRRREARRPQFTAAEEIDAVGQSRPVADWIELCEEAAVIREKMGELAVDQRRVLALSIEGDCSHVDIAERLSLPLGTVKSHARRGLIRLRELVTDRRPRKPVAGGRP